MNQLFEKIATEVFFDESTNGEGQKMYTFGDQKMQKFAEAIVQECLRICEHGSATQTTSAGAAVMIQQHFGLSSTSEPQRPAPLDSSYPDGDGYWK